LKSELIEIYTDVDGVMTADPNIVEKAALLNRIVITTCSNWLNTAPK
jgi:aspartokinase